MARWILVLTVALTVSAAGQGGTTTDARPGQETERLAALGRLWTAVRYAHPYLTYRNIDWDAALVAAIPKVRAATSTTAYAEAVSGMLAALQDPATRLRDTSPPPSRSSASRAPLFETQEGVLVLRFSDDRIVGDYGRMISLLQEHIPAMREASAVVIDLRRSPAASYVLQTFFQFAGPYLTSREVSGPATRTVFHSGYAPQVGGTSGGYYSALHLTLPQAVVPVPDVAPKRVAFVLDRRSFIPELALALQRSGDGIIVSEGAIDEGSIVTPMPVPLTEGLVALVRTGEVIEPAGVAADVVIGGGTNGGSDAAMTQALAFVKGGPPPRRRTPPSSTAPPESPVWRPEKTYDDPAYPSVEHRILGVYRLWGVVQYFFPYKHLMTKDWNAALAEYIPKAIAAKDALEYGLVIANMATWLEDSHVNVSSGALRPFYGPAGLPFRVRYIEGVPVVTGFIDEAAATKAGVRIGDVVVSVDGENVPAREARFTPYTTASNPWSLKSKLASYLLRGAEGCTASLVLTGGDGGRKEVSLVRRSSYLTATPSEEGPTYRMLDGNIGYVDLTRFESREVDAMFDAFMGTKAIIFDMRGYPRGVFMALAPRLNRKEARYAATFLRPLVSAGSPGGSYTFQQGIPPATKPRYAGRTVMIIDERAISQSEHTGLFLEAASDVTFIGTPTAGANGDVTRVILPGSVMVGFTGHDVRHADGRQLQKVGLEPHVRVEPTIAGIRAGRDELLERAIRFVNEGT